MGSEECGPRLADLEQRIADGGIVVLEALPNYVLGEGAPAGGPDEDTPVAVYCSNSACKNSHVVAMRLTELGYTDVSRYTEGKQDWIEAGLPVESAAPAA